MAQIPTFHHATLRSACARLLAGGLLAIATQAEAAEPEPQVLFRTRCASCHTFGKGERVGPDLKGVAERHPRAWLTAWIRSSDALIQAGDAAAVALFTRYRRQRMPDHDLSDPQIEALVDYLAAGGPERDARSQVRVASSATPEEVRLGGELFFGRARLASGGVACGACHSLSAQRSLGASLAPDLSRVFSKYQDKGLSQVLARSCLPQAPDVAPPLSATESLALRAFLRSADGVAPLASGPHGFDHGSERRSEAP